MTQDGSGFDLARALERLADELDPPAYRSKPIAEMTPVERREHVAWIARKVREEGIDLREIVRKVEQMREQGPDHAA